jgi:hypothetical protein
LKVNALFSVSPFISSMKYVNEGEPSLSLGLQTVVSTVGVWVAWKSVNERLGKFGRRGNKRNSVKAD